MARPLWPPNYVRMPIELLTHRSADGRRLPAGALETWCDFRALAWGRTETEPLDFARLHELLGKGRSTLCGHLAELAGAPASGLSWKIADGCLVVSFDDAGDDAGRVQESGLVQKAGPATGAPALENKPSPESRTLDSHTNTVKDSVKNLNRGRAVQKSGLTPSRKPDSDPRTKHAAIQACRQVAERYPDTSLYDRLIAALGESPDIEKMRRCRAEWVDRGYNGNAWKWATEWYVSGIPERQGGRPAPRPQPAAEPALSPAQQRIREQNLKKQEAARAQNR